MAVLRSLFFCCRHTFFLDRLQKLHHMTSLSSLFSPSCAMNRSLLHTFPSLRPNPSLFVADPIHGRRRFASGSNTNNPAAFDFSDSDEEEGATKKTKEIDKSKLPPPYDPFSKKPVIEEPKDPKDLQEVFHNMRSEGLYSSAVKMFDGLSKDGLTHEALELFSQIKDKGSMPDVVAHTAVIEAYSNAGQAKEAHRVYLRMLASGVRPNAYTFSVLIKGLSSDGKTLSDAGVRLLDMLGEGMRPNVATYAAVFEAFAREKRVEEGRALLERLRAKGFVPDERALRDHLAKRRQVYRTVMSMLFEDSK